MLTRSKTNIKRENLKNSLRERCNIGDLAAGQPVPGVRDLASEFGLSRDVVTDLLKELVVEGVLYTVPRVGTFAGRPQNSAHQTYLMVYGPNPLQSATGQLAKMGFEDRLTELGADAIVMETTMALTLQKAGNLPPISGVLDFSRIVEHNVADATKTEWLINTETPDLPRVYFGAWPLNHPLTDYVTFDDLRGGSQATRHLIDRGHKRIAYLAFHPADDTSRQWNWSQDRETGWSQAMAAANLDSDGLSFHPAEETVVEDSDGIKRVMEAPVQQLINCSGITAVVAANDAVAHCLLDGLQASGVHQNHWPAIVGFDGSAEMSGQLLTSLRMPWNEVGRAAADLMWNRANVVRDSKPQVKRFQMRLITRLSCRPNWSRNAGEATLAVARSS